MGFLALTVLARFVPFSPTVPREDLDSSWVYAMNQTIEQGLEFGKDLIFTFGPYASVCTKNFHPATDFYMILGAGYIGIFYTYLLYLLLKGKELRWVIIFCILIACLISSSDALLLSYPMLLALVIFRFNSVDDQEVENSHGAKYNILVPLLFTPFGLISLIKGTFAVVCVIVIILCFLLLIARKKILQAILSLLSPIFSLVVFWLISGQKIDSLPLFFSNLLPIMSGYTQAMSGGNSPDEIGLFAMTSLIILYIILSLKTRDLSSKLFLFFISASLLFNVFKIGFVRHDAHALIASNFILVFAFSIALIIKHQYINYMLFSALITFGVINIHYEGFISNLKPIYFRTYEGLNTRFFEKEGLGSKFNQSNDLLKKSVNFPILEGTTDIYSYNQSYLIASGYKWSPRPIFQSYSAYTPKLAQLNAAHLTSEKAPDNIIFKLQTIDGRYPSLDDGLSWPILLNQYTPSILNEVETFNSDKENKGFMYLHKNPNQTENVILIEIRNQNCKLGEKIHLPLTNEPLFAQIKLEQTLLGHILSFFYKSPKLIINVELVDGSEKNFVLIANMAESGFVISPLVENTSEFLFLYGDTSYMKTKDVKSMTIFTRASSLVTWKPNYKLSLSQIKTNKCDLTKIIKEGVDYHRPACNCKEYSIENYVRQ